MGLDAERQPERRVLAIKQAESRVERDGLTVATAERRNLSEKLYLASSAVATVL